MYNIFYENLILVPSIAFLLAILIKRLIVKMTTWSFKLEDTLSSGGMPSVHSALVTALATAIVIKHWIQSDFFAIALSFTIIILYDAINVRFEAWLHASAINKLLGESFKESLWHLPSEAFAGSLLWVFTAIALYYV